MMVEHPVPESRLSSYAEIYRIDKTSSVRMWFWIIIGILFLILFLPWTQNIKMRGTITSRMQEQRPQEIHSPIPGRIAKWYIKEGDFVKKGDTLLKITEIKENYLDPELIERTREQLEAKKGSVSNYQEKVQTANRQLAALREAKELKITQLKNKLKQLENKLTGEKAELEAAGIELELAKDQYERQLKLFQQGLVSQTQLQQRNLAWQNASAKKVTVENKLAQTRQEMINVQLEQNSVEQEYTEKISKVEGERFQSLSDIAGGQADLAKLQNQVAGYVIRNGMYLLLAPQDGQVVQAGKSGIGEIIKEGERIVVIVPENINYAVELFVRPVDLPLISNGQRVRFTFDGFPAIVFSGWPENSYGTFGGRIVAIEHTISPNGYFRILVSEDPTQKPWPKQLKIGGGAQGIALLKDVPIWYELWRNINGFPPDYYTLKEPVEKNGTKPK